MTTTHTSPVITDAPQSPPIAEVVIRFKELFNALSAGNITGLSDVYSEDIRFTDPFGNVEGLDSLQDYFEKVYANVTACRFEFSDTLISDQDVCVVWTMHLQHPRLSRGKPRRVHGISRLTIDQGRVSYHRDYFDAGELLYENLPVIGRAIRWIRSYAS